MSQRSRLNLKDLVALRKPLVQSPDETTSTDTVDTHFQAIATPLAAPPAVPLMVPGDVSPRVLEQRKEKRRLIAQSFKLPADLDERWSKIAAFNKITKTGILIEALETFLDRLPQPPLEPHGE